MRRLMWIEIVAAVIVGITWLVMLHNRPPMISDDAQIVSFEYSHSGSSTYEIYSYTMKRDTQTGEMIVDYELNCGNESYSLPADDELLQQLAAMIEVHELWNWDGFDKVNSHMLDGSGFELSISYDDGTCIDASGSNSFPEGFGEASRAVDELFHGYLKNCGIVLEGGY